MLMSDIEHPPKTPAPKVENKNPTLGRPTRMLMSDIEYPPKHCQPPCSTLNSKPSSLDPRPSTLNPELLTSNPDPNTET
jgi:hypothetical protein